MTDRTTSNMTVLGVDNEQGLATLYAEWLAGTYTARIAYTSTQAIEFDAAGLGTVFRDPISLTGDL